ncbi:MAG: peptidylprolyl isomerase [Chitinivibrionales bacterium]
MKKKGNIIVFGLAAAALMWSAVQSSQPEKGQKMEDGLYAKMHTNKGTMVLSLEFEKTPLTVANFVGLAEGGIPNSAKKKGQPYYDGLIFHRVVPNFVIQGGDPDGNGRGGPGYSFEDEFDPSLRHDRAGILSMANAGPGTNGSQFFITLNKTPHLDDRHSVFGHVIEGMDVVNAIRQGDTIQRVEIIRQGTSAKAFTVDKNDSYKEIVSIAEGAVAAKKDVAENLGNTIAEKFPDARKTESGLHYIIRKEGDGQKPQPGSVVSVHYKGTLLDGKEFDSSYKRGKPIQFPVGAGRVIPGWDEGVMMMSRGEKRTLILPPSLGYGAGGVPGAIPPNAILVFDVELVDF